MGDQQSKDNRAIQKLRKKRKTCFLISLNHPGNLIEYIQSRNSLQNPEIMKKYGSFDSKDTMQSCHFWISFFIEIE